MTLIEFYLLRRLVNLFFTVLLAAIGVSWTVQILTRIDFLTTSGQNLLTVFEFSTLFIPSSLVLVAPFALVIAATQVLSQMNGDCELVVIGAAGAPRRMIWRPVLFAGLVVALASFLIANFVAPHARLTMRNMLGSANADLINLVLTQGNFRALGEGVYIEIGERRADGSIGRLFIVDERSPEFDLYYYAVNGGVVDRQGSTSLLLQQGEIQRIDKRRGDTSIIQFDSYSFDLSSFTPAARPMTLFPKDRFLADLMDPDVDDPYYQRRPAQYSAELHRRFTEWLYPFVFALVALAAAGSARSHREGRVPPSLVAIVLALIIYWLGYFVGGRADNDLGYLPLLYLVPIGSMAGLWMMLLTNHPLALPARWDDALCMFWDGIRRRLGQNGWRVAQGEQEEGSR